MKKLAVSLFTLLFSLNAFAEEGAQLSPTAEEILYGEPANTQCATSVFANALRDDSNAPSEMDDEETIQQWIYGVFADPDVLTQVLACPEMQYFADDESVRFMPIQYDFPNGRQITINYETQPLVLKQRVTLGSKRSTEALNDPSPRIGTGSDNGIWLNTDPAWYAIMVVQHGALDNFVGPDKNNTISIKYINENIDKLYPRGATCTSKSALANDNYIINVATHDTVDMKDDSNDYYVAGDVNLQWISYTEIALDVVITVATMGGGAVITGVTKATRASKVVKNLSRIIHGLDRADTLARLKKYQKLEKELSALDKARDAAKYEKTFSELKTVEKQLHKIDKLTDASKYSKEIEALEKATQAVQDYVKLETKWDKSQRTIRRIKKVQELEQDLAKMDKVADGAKYTDKLNDLNKAKSELRQFDKLGTTAKQSERLTQIEKREAKILELQKQNPSKREAQKLRQELTSLRQERNTIFNQIDNVTDYETTLKNLEKEASELEKSMAEAVKKDKSVAQYADAKKAMREISEATKSYRNLRNAKAGNVATRLLRAFVQTTKGNKAIERGAKIARSSMKSGRVRDWLFQTTLRNIGALGRLETKGGALYAVLKFAGDMYDWTETSTGEYTNGVDFKPLLLLSADDLKGQENVVNYGMWLMWAGDSTNPADDDAAYLQSFDFADKFHEDLLRTMEEKNNHACNVDIYVVRPVLRNPDTDNPEMYYLIMNDQPWSTAE